MYFDLQVLVANKERFAVDYDHDEWVDAFVSERGNGGLFGSFIRGVHRRREEPVIEVDEDVTRKTLNIPIYARLF